MRDELFAAYRSTTFYADTPAGRLGVRIGQRHVELDKIVELLGAKSWGYISACNPRSTRLSLLENSTRQQQLEQVLSDQHILWFAGEGVGDYGDWPPEKSVLAVGVSSSLTIEIGRRFGQNAIIFGQVNGVAELLECSQ